MGETGLGEAVEGIKGTFCPSVRVFSKPKTALNIKFSKKIYIS